MMDSAVEGRESSSDSDTQLSLEALFKHPAGLQTARDLVKQIVAQTRTQPTERVANDATASISTITNSSPEVAGILREVLAFSDLESQNSWQAELLVASSNVGAVRRVERARTLMIRFFTPY